MVESGRWDEDFVNGETPPVVRAALEVEGREGALEGLSISTESLIR